MRFDWYQATIADDHGAIVDTLLQQLGDGHTVEVGRGMHGYQSRAMVVNPAGDTVAGVLFGGNGGAWPNAWASGEDTEPFVEVVRGCWGDRHVVTRMDAAEDFVAQDAYARIRAVVRSVAKDAKVKRREILPDEDPEEGRTYYAGSPSSAVRVRVYEKGLQLRSQLPEAKAQEIPRDWTRAEVSVRPKGEARHIAARIEAAEAWGCAAWTKKAALGFMALDVPLVRIKPWRESDDERAYRFMIRQYGALLERLMPDYGSWAALGAQIGYDWGEWVKAKR